MHSLPASRSAPRILVIDNYDSFTWNLVHDVARAGAHVDVVRNDEMSVDALLGRAPDGLLISPGPGAPASAGITLEAILRFAGRIPIFGVCLGHQAIGEALGGKVVRSVEIVHGKKTKIALKQSPLFAGLPSRVEVGRYHSLVVDKESLPSALRVTAYSPKGEIMAFRHRTLDIEGVQFHPESILTEHGRLLTANWVALCKERRSQRRALSRASRKARSVGAGTGRLQ